MEETDSAGMRDEMTNGRTERVEAYGQGYKVSQLRSGYFNLFSVWKRNRKDMNFVLWRTEFETEFVLRENMQQNDILTLLNVLSTDA